MALNFTWFKRLNPFRKRYTITFDTSLFNEWATEKAGYLASGGKIDTSYIEIQPLGWYFDAANIPNQDMLHDVYDYLENGARKGFADPHKFLGVSYLIYNYFTQSENLTIEWMQFIKLFNLSPEELHVIFSIILFWHGGYPTRDRFEGQQQSALRQVEREFLKYEKDTPEKEFCRAKVILKDGKRWIEKKTLNSETVELMEIPDIEPPKPLSDNSEDENTAKRTKEFTTARQVMAMYYLLNEMGIWYTVDKTKTVEFIRFLTDKSKDEIYRKMTRPIDNKKNESKQKEDFDYIIPLFENLGLEDLVKKIKGDRDNINTQ